MADVTKIKLPDNSTVNIKDYRIPGVDTEPTSGSDNLVTSGGVYKDIEDASRVTSAALNDLNDRLTTVEDGGDWVTTEEFHQLEGVAKDTYTIAEVDALLDNLENQYVSEETDPTVPAWAKAPNKPTYTASEVGALSSSTIIPTKVSDLTNDSNFTTKTYVDAIKYASSKSVGGPADKAVSIPFATVAGTSTATTFTATVDGITELRDGICFYLRNNKITSASGWTLNINGLGAKPVYLSDSSSTRCTTQFENNGYYLFIYNTARVQDGCFDLCQLFDTNTTYTNASLGHGYGTCSTAYGTAAKTVTCSGYLLTTGGYITVNFTNDVDANATLNVNSKGAKAIYYQGVAIGDKVIKAGDTALFIYNTYYYLVSIDRGGGTGTVTSVNIGSTAYNPTNGIISLPAYPTTLPASDVSAWAKASTKPTYTASEVGALPSTTVIPDAQVQSDWNATSGMGVILNKPEVPSIIFRTW